MLSHRASWQTGVCEKNLGSIYMEKHFKIEKSNKPHKKYMAIMEDGSVVHFVDTRYQQYEDKTPLELYKNLDHHHDEKRRSLYY